MASAPPTNQPLLYNEEREQAARRILRDANNLNIDPTIIYKLETPVYARFFDHRTRTTPDLWTKHTRLDAQYSIPHFGYIDCGGGGNCGFLSLWLALRLYMGIYVSSDPMDDTHRIRLGDKIITYDDLNRYKSVTVAQYEKIHFTRQDNYNNTFVFPFMPVPNAMRYLAYEGLLNLINNINMNQTTPALFPMGLAVSLYLQEMIEDDRNRYGEHRPTARTKFRAYADLINVDDSLDQQLTDSWLADNETMLAVQFLFTECLSRRENTTVSDSAWLEYRKKQHLQLRGHDSMTIVLNDIMPFAVTNRLAAFAQTYARHLPRLVVGLRDLLLDWGKLIAEEQTFGSPDYWMTPSCVGLLVESTFFRRQKLGILIAEEAPNTVSAKGFIRTSYIVDIDDDVAWCILYAPIGGGHFQLGGVIDRSDRVPQMWFRAHPFFAPVTENIVYGIPEDFVGYLKNRNSNAWTSYLQAKRIDGLKVQALNTIVSDGLQRIDRSIIL